MTTIGWLLILLAGVCIRALTRGRSLGQVPGDIGDVFIGLVTGNTDEVRNALTRTGPTNVAVVDNVNVNAAVLQGSSTKGAAVVAYAATFAGVPYKWGGTDPVNGMDCSGYTQVVFKHFGVNLPRTTFQQIAQGTGVAKTDLQPGDLVFPTPDHVQIYAGNGTVWEEPHTGAACRHVAMWGFLTARRVI